MHRRNLLRTALAAPLALLATSRVTKAAPGNIPGVVYHLSDVDKVGHTLENISNHYLGMGGPEMVRIVLVVNGAALRAFFLDGEASLPVRSFERLRRQGLQAQACVNTLRGMKVEIGALMPGFTLATKGGVVALAELQGQGYAYIRP